MPHKKYVDFLAGVNGGIATVYSGQPLDTVKVKLQTFSHLYNGSTVRCLLDTFRKDGIRGLYAGSTPALLANVLENSILFAGYGMIQREFVSVLGLSNVHQLTTVQNASAGALASIVSATILCPVELIKCRMQATRELYEMNKHSQNVQDKAFKPGEPISIAVDVLKREGVRGFYRGFTPMLVREVPGYFVFFGAYDLCRTMLARDGVEKHELGVFQTWIAGGVAGVACWGAIFPADVLKSRMQVQEIAGNPLRLCKDIVVKEGFLALYKGFGATAVRTFVASGALFLAVEATKDLLY